MFTLMENSSGNIRSVFLKLDGADPLMNAVTREVAFRAHGNVVRQGDVPRAAHLILEGYACKFRLLRDGRRQITAILIPGDLCDLEALMRGRADCGVATLTPCVLGEIQANHVANVDGVDPVLRRILWRRLLRDEAVAREWTVVLGRRTARERLAHLLCEYRERMRMVGLGRDNDNYDLTLTQIDFADALGLSVVHVNRTVQDLRRRGLIEFGKKLLRIVDPEALARMAEFNPAYLAIP